jgi:hypothetical protein
LFVQKYKFTPGLVELWFEKADKTIDSFYNDLPDSLKQEHDMVWTLYWLCSQGPSHMYPPADSEIYNFLKSSFNKLFTTGNISKQDSFFLKHLKFSFVARVMNLGVDQCFVLLHEGLFKPGSIDDESKYKMTKNAVEEGRTDRIKLLFNIDSDVEADGLIRYFQDLKDINEDNIEHLNFEFLLQQKDPFVLYWLLRCCPDAALRKLMTKLLEQYSTLPDKYAMLGKILSDLYSLDSDHLESGPDLLQPLPLVPDPTPSQPFKGLQEILSGKMIEDNQSLKEYIEMIINDATIWEKYQEENPKIDISKIKSFFTEMATYLEETTKDPDEFFKELNFYAEVLGNNPANNAEVLDNNPANNDLEAACTALKNLRKGLKWNDVKEFIEQCKNSIGPYGEVLLLNNLYPDHTTEPYKKLKEALSLFTKEISEGSVYGIEEDKKAFYNKFRKKTRSIINALKEREDAGSIIDNLKAQAGGCSEAYKEALNLSYELLLRPQEGVTPQDLLYIELARFRTECLRQAAKDQNPKVDIPMEVHQYTDAVYDLGEELGIIADLDTMHEDPFDVEGYDSEKIKEIFYNKYYTPEKIVEHFFEMANDSGDKRNECFFPLLAERSGWTWGGESHPQVSEALQRLDQELENLKNMEGKDSDEEASMKERIMNDMKSILEPIGLSFILNFDAVTNAPNIKKWILTTRNFINKQATNNWYEENVTGDPEKRYENADGKLLIRENLLLDVVGLFESLGIFKSSHTVASDVEMKDPA